MQRLSSTYGPHGDVEPMVGHAMQVRAPGAEARVCVPPHRAATEEGDAPVATGLLSSGVWR